MYSKKSKSIPSLHSCKHWLSSSRHSSYSNPASHSDNPNWCVHMSPWDMRATPRTSPNFHCQTPYRRHRHFPSERYCSDSNTGLDNCHRDSNSPNMPPDQTRNSRPNTFALRLKEQKKFPHTEEPRIQKISSLISCVQYITLTENSKKYLSCQAPSFPSTSNSPHSTFYILSPSPIFIFHLLCSLIPIFYLLHFHLLLSTFQSKQTKTPPISHRKRFRKKPSKNS